MQPVFSIHEHELREGVDPVQYEKEVSAALQTLHIPGLLHVRHLKGFKGKRVQKYTVLWTFESEDAIVQNFGTSDNPKWPEDWLRYENDVLAKFLDRHPDKIDFTDFHVIQEVAFD